MFRVTFLIDDPDERHRLADELRSLTMGGDARIVSAFADAKTVEVYLEIGERVVWRDVTDQLAQRLGVDEYEVTRAEPLLTVPPAGAGADATGRRRLRPAAITQVRVHPDGCTLSVQARHRQDETVETVDVQQTDEAVAVTVLLSAPDDVRDHYVSFAVAFTWVDTTLDRPVGNRRIVH